jgi:hypothetical protein
MSLLKDMEAIMALPYKTGSQNIIDFIEYVGTKPAGGIWDGLNRAINNSKSSSSFVIVFAGVSAERNREQPLFPLWK